MSKEKNDFLSIILVSIIWIARPISYHEMRRRHPIYPHENVVVVNSSSILNQNDELDFLESTTKKIILTKNNFFADGFTPPLPQREGSRTTNGLGGSNPGNGSGGSSPAPSPGNLDGNGLSNPTPKFPWELS